MSNQIVTANAVRNIFVQTEADMRAARALKMMLPYGDKLTDDNAYALLIYGRLHDLDPLNQECYFLVREKTDKQTGQKVREEMGCYPGIKGKRKKAREQSMFKVEYTTIDAKSIGLDPNVIAVCVKAELRDHQNEGDYLVKMMELVHAGFKREDIEYFIGKPPVVTGYGAVKRDELWRLTQEPIKVARKRAENDAITQRFDLPMTDMIADDVTPELTEGEGENGNAQPPKLTQIDTPKKTEAQILAELGYAPEPKKNGNGQQAQPEAEQPEPEVTEGEYTETGMTVQEAMDTLWPDGTRFEKVNDIKLGYLLKHPDEFTPNQFEAAKIVMSVRGQTA